MEIDDSPGCLFSALPVFRGSRGVKYCPNDHEFMLVINREIDHVRKLFKRQAMHPIITDLEKRDLVEALSVIFRVTSFIVLFFTYLQQAKYKCSLISATALFVFLTASAWARIISANFRFASYGNNPFQVFLCRLEICG